VQTGAQPEPRDTPQSLQVALLTNFVPPYRAPLFKLLAQRFAAFRIFVSTTMEPNRSWQPGWEGLDVELLRGFSLQRTERHPHDFTNPVFVHLPYSVLFRLWKVKPDVVVSGQLGFASIMAALYCALQRRSALVLWLTLSEVSELGRGWIRRSVRRLLLARARAVMVNGASGERYARSLGASKQKIFRVYQAVDNAAFSDVRERSPATGHRLLFVGSTGTRKGLLPFLGHLARWAAAHRSQSVELRIAGADESPTAFESDPPVNMVVRWLGAVPYDQMPSVYAEATILVFPTLTDEWGLVVNEAMAAGIPVLGSHYSQAVEELVEDGVTGWTFHPDRADECRTAIDRALAASSEERAEMRSACRERIAAFSFAATAERMAEAIEFAASKRKL